MTHPTSRRLQQQPLTSVRQVIGQLQSGHHPTRQLGEVTLMPHQVDALLRIEQTMARHHGALLADDVGLGKTFVALALGERYDVVHVIAPAALLPMWKEAIRRAGSGNVTLHSLHRVSHREHALRVADSERMLVILDEAHHLRHRNTLRYARIAAFVAGRDVVLLSATPVHNRADELRTLLALFLGDRADALDADMLARLVIRRTQDHAPCVEADGSTRRDHSVAADAGERVPAVVDVGHLPTPDDHLVLDAILGLPDPLPARDGTTAGALIRLGLLRAWCSSDAALAHSVRQRRLRGEALRHALQHGRHPSREELRHWVIGDDAVQLAFPELMSTPVQRPASLMELLHDHLEALSRLQLLHASRGGADAVRARALVSLLKSERDRPIVAFSQFRQTVTALSRALSDIAGIGTISGREARIASGRLPRHELLQRFAPRAMGVPPPAPHERVMLLLSTDLLAEGVNLQDAGTVVHLDLPWTDALRRQRVGRCARIGASYDPVRVFTMAPPPGADTVLQLSAHLARKAGLSAALIGASGDSYCPTTSANRGSVDAPINRSGDAAAPTLSPPAPSPAQVATRLRERWNAWAAASHRREACDFVPLAMIRADRHAWIASICDVHGARVVAHFDDETSDAIAHIEQSTEWLDTASFVDLYSRCPTPLRHSCMERAAPVLRARRQLREWLCASALDDAIGPALTQVGVAQRRALRVLATCCGELPPIPRHTLAASIASCQYMVRAVRGVGAECALQEWVSTAPSVSANSPLVRESFEQWIDAWRESPVLSRFASDGATARREALERRETGARLVALIVALPC